MYFDPQNEPVAGFCPICGCALYEPGLTCIRCGRDEDDTGTD